MILVAAYPDNFKCYAIAAVVEHGGLGVAAPIARDILRDIEPSRWGSYHNSYNKAEKHFNNVSEWCKKCLCGPYELDKEQDLLFDGVRIRLGRESDIAYFQLKWG